MYFAQLVTLIKQKTVYGIIVREVVIPHFTLIRIIAFWAFHYVTKINGFYRGYMRYYIIWEKQSFDLLTAYPIVILHRA